MNTKTRIARLEELAWSSKKSTIVAFGRPDGTYWVENKGMDAQQFERWRKTCGYRRVIVVRFVRP